MSNLQFEKAHKHIQNIFISIRKHLLVVSAYRRWLKWEWSDFDANNDALVGHMKRTIKWDKNRDKFMDSSNIQDDATIERMDLEREGDSPYLTY